MKKFILVLVITIISSFTNLFTTEVKEENQDNLIISEKDEKIEVVDSDNITEDIVETIEKQQEIKQEQEAEVKQEEKITEKEENNTKKSTTSTNSQSKNEESNNKKINIETQTTTATISETNIESNNYNTNTEVITTKKETVVNEITTPIEEYKVNESKIAEIRNIIDKNPSEDMKLYGYQVIVDSSITGITTQFTFTEKRVKDKIALKFGTIRIYAQDYYKNGQYICTQCFII